METPIFFREVQVLVLGPRRPVPDWQDTLCVLVEPTANDEGGLAGNVELTANVRGQAENGLLC